MAVLFVGVLPCRMADSVEDLPAVTSFTLGPFSLIRCPHVG